MLKKIKPKYLVAAAILCLTCLFPTVGNTLAYLTDSEAHTNTFTYGDVHLDLVETNWNKTASFKMVPNRTIQKNPKAINTGKEPEWVIIKVDMPYVPSGIVVNKSTGKPKAAANTPAFLMNTVNPASWQLLNNGPVFNSSNKIATYVYGYKTTLSASASTTELFTTVTLDNFLDGTTFNSSDIVVTAYGVQAEGVANVATAWSLVNNQDADRTPGDADTSGRRDLKGNNR